MKQLEKRITKLENIISEESSQGQVIIYDPAKGAPIPPINDSGAVVFLLPHNGRD